MKDQQHKKRRRIFSASWALVIIILPFLDSITSTFYCHDICCCFTFKTTTAGVSEAAAGASFSKHPTTPSAHLLASSVFHPTKLLTVNSDVIHYLCTPNHKMATAEDNFFITRRSALEESAMALRNWYLLETTTKSKLRIGNNNLEQDDRVFLEDDDDSSDDDDESSDDDDDSSSTSDSSSDDDDSSSDDDDDEKSPTFLYLRPIITPLIKRSK